MHGTGYRFSPKDLGYLSSRAAASVQREHIGCIAVTRFYIGRWGRRIRINPAGRPEYSHRSARTGRSSIVAELSLATAWLAPRWCAERDFPEFVAIPAHTMQQRAPAVYRWLERMNREDQDAPEYFNAGNDFLANDEIPETLIPVLKILAEDFLPETLAAADLINSWLDEHQPEPGAIAVGRLSEALGTADFTVRGETITALAQPHRFYLLQHVQDVFTKLSYEKQTEISTVLEACGMKSLLAAVLSRRIVRSENLEVWQRPHST